MLLLLQHVPLLAVPLDELALLDDLLVGHDELALHTDADASRVAARLAVLPGQLVDHAATCVCAKREKESCKTSQLLSQRVIYVVV